MAYTTIDDPTAYFQTKLYTGNSSTQVITFDGNTDMQPDFVWAKPRVSGGHFLSDSIRGGTKVLQSASTGAEITRTQNIQSFNTNGYTLAGDGTTNSNGDATVSWNWKAGGSGVANTDGGINSTVSVNNTSGFSIVKYGTGTGSATTVGHGMNTAPNFIIIKPLGTIQTGNWIIGGDNLDNTWNNVIELNTTFAKANDPSFNDTAPTSSVFSVGNNNTNRSGENYIAYCFAEKKGYSKFSSFVGNASSDGSYIHLGFSPAFVMLKSTGVNHWVIYDNKRNSFNLVNNKLNANENEADNIGSANALDFLSNGFKCRATNSASNGSGQEYIFMAFAESSFVTSTGIPTTAR
jgi:hypothetical protein